MYPALPRSVCKAVDFANSKLSLHHRAILCLTTKSFRMRREMARAIHRAIGVPGAVSSGPELRKEAARYRTGSGSDRIQALNVLPQVFLPQNCRLQVESRIRSLLPVL
jgi:hypothetical protein